MTPHGRQEPRPFPADVGWERPLQISQLDLFTKPRDRMLALTGVSIEEVERWRGRGWISFDLRELPVLDSGELAEVCFIRNLARSGLSDVQVDVRPGELNPPYRYDPVRTAYSFAFGWVQLPPLPDDGEIDALIEHHLDQWIQRKAAKGEKPLLANVAWKFMEAARDATEAGAGGRDG